MGVGVGVVQMSPTADAAGSQLTPAHSDAGSERAGGMRQAVYFCTTPGVAGGLYWNVKGANLAPWPRAAAA